MKESAISPIEKEEYRKRADTCLLAFPTVGALHFLSQQGLRAEITHGGILVDDDAGNRFGPDKMQAGVLGFLYATRQLDIVDGKYVISDSSLISEVNLKAARSALALTQRIGQGDLSEVTSFAVRSIPEQLRSGLVVPIMDAIHRQADIDLNDEKKSLKTVQKLLKEKAHTGTKELLIQLKLSDEKGNLNEAGKTLLMHRVMGSYARLTASYINMISNLADASQNPDACKFGGEYSRDQQTNAEASNQLIINIVEKMQKTIEEEGNIETILDLGSGGGVFALGIGVPNTILFDMSKTANDHALRLFHRSADKGRRVKAITGDITNLDDLKRAAAEYPNAVTINFIIHDIIGQAPTREEGLATIRLFLANYKEAFGSTPLIVTESWDVSWEDLRLGNKSYITLYTFLHAISPQRLISKQTFLDLLSEAGFQVRKVIKNGDLLIHGVPTHINETLIVEVPEKEIVKKNGQDDRIPLKSA